MIQTGADHEDWKIRVMLVDDDPLVLSSLKTYLRTTTDIRVVAEAHNGIDALKILDTIDIDIILADIHMPEMDGVALLHELQKLSTTPPFVAITALDTDHTMLNVLAGGAAGYIVKSSEPHVIINAIRDAFSGGTAISPQALTRLVRYLPSTMESIGPQDKEFQTIYTSLTDVEKCVLAHVCNGLSNSEIAEAMFYSESTVKKQVSQLIGIFGVTSRLSLAVTAIRLGNIG